ncbi:hypothetical protein LCGC14_1546840 [marine sediment metagenome]|uniref:Uncharacterized protein n=1 Tax=marine sediment metagenome TaxID=412755 RepID=A0A0F9IRD7_9ZZZZ
MEWFILLMPLFQKWIENCQKRRSRSKIQNGLNNPGIMERWALRSVIREELGLSGRELREKVREGMTELRSASEDDVQELMDGVPAIAD